MPAASPAPGGRRGAGCLLPMNPRPLAAVPDLLALHRLDPARYPVLLESSSGGALGRHDLLLAHAGEGFALHRDGRVRTLAGAPVDGRFLDVLDAHWQDARAAAGGDSTGPARPFRGGWALLLDYELAAQVESVLQLPAAEGGLPVAVALRCPAALLRDRANGDCIAVAEAGAEAWLQRIADDAGRAGALPPLPAWTPPIAIDEDPPQRYLDGVARVLEYLAAGDVFQANLSRGWRARFAHALDPAALFARLRRHNPAPFAGIFRSPWGSVVSASPERLLSLHAGIAHARQEHFLQQALLAVFVVAALEVGNRKLLARHDRGDRMLVDQLRLTIAAQQDREIVKPGDDALQLDALHQKHGDRNLILAQMVEEHVLKVLPLHRASAGDRCGRRRRRSGLGRGCGFRLGAGTRRQGLSGHSCDSVLLAGPGPFGAIPGLRDLAHDHCGAR